MPQHCGKYLIGIARIHRQRGNLLPVSEPKMGPRLSRIGRFVNPVADGKVGPVQSLSTPDVNDVRIGRRNRNRADGLCRLLIEDRIPGTPVVIRFPYSAIYLPHVEDIWLAGNAGSSACPSPAQRTIMRQCKSL